MGHILKNEDIHVGEPFSLPVDGSAAVTSASGGGQPVRIIEQQAGYSVIEVVCACGQTLRIRCEHPA